MTNPTTDYMSRSACSTCARDAVHRFSMPGLGFGSVHGLLGIFRKNNEEVPRGNSLERFCLALATFFENVRASVQFAETHARQGTPANGQVLGTRGSVQATARICASHHNRHRLAQTSPLATATTKLVHRDAARLPLF